MVEVLNIVFLLLFIGLLVYFRYTDVRNVTLNTLKDYLKQSEKHIESMLQKKVKEFNDHIIPSEITIDRMKNFSNAINESLDKFDSDIARGNEIFSALREQIDLVQAELEDHKKTFAIIFFETLTYCRYDAKQAHDILDKGIITIIVIIFLCILISPMKLN